LNKQNKKPGRILCVTSTLPRWSGDAIPHFVLHLAQDLQDLGWQVDILAPYASGAAHREILQGISIFRFPYFWPSHSQTLCYQSGALINIRENKSNLLKIPFFLVAEYLAIVKKLRQKHYDLIHCHWVIPQGFTGILASMPLKVPQITTIHGSDIHSLNSTFFNQFKAFTLKHSKAVTVNSSSTRQACTDVYKNHPQLHKIPMGISLPVLDQGKIKNIRQKFTQNEVSPLIIFAGRLIAEKGVGDLINAINLLSDHLPDIKLLILGSGKKQEYYQGLSKRHALVEKISFVGWLDPEVLPLYLAAADIFVAPSWKEAQGLSIIEAMAAKTAVIATSVGGIPDIVQHEKTGLLIAEKSPQQIMAAILRLTKDTTLRKKLIRQGYELVNNHYSRKQTAQKFSQLFQEISATA